ncbi:ankyrin repeat-containing domain protein [Mycena olivaceomarginata]|nr:ankyrin repeat-containing domain protein [Mycena olivaceomarginata]
MPLAAFAYGSFGDIVATAELLVKIVTLLHRSGKPSSVWEETEKELTSLDRELKYLILKLTPTLDPLVTQRVREEVANCNRTMVKFYAKISVPKNVWQTVLWARSEEKALKEFKMQVVEHRTALGVVLGLLNLGALSAVSDQVTDGHDRIREGVDGLTERLTSQSDLLAEISGQVEEGNDGILVIQERVAGVSGQVSEGNDGIRLVQEHLKEVGRQVGHGTDQIQIVQQGLTEQAAYQKERLTEAQISDREEKLNKWLDYPPSMGEKQHETQKVHHEGTGSWFLDGPQFTEWKDNSGVLWIQGKSGTGKSVLSSTAIRKLFNDKPLSGTAVAYFYFDFRDNKRQLVEIMLRTIILQLSAQSLHPYAVLHQQYESSKGQTLPTYPHLLEVLDKLLSEFGRTYIVLDALDECTEDDILVQFISRLRQWTTTPLHLLVTSQPRQFYTNALASVTKVTLELESTERDIKLFVSHELRSQRYLEHVSQRAEEITPKVVKKSNGMFRLAACLLQELSRSKLNPDLNTILANLPGNLFGIYRRFLKPIDQADFVYVARVLRWLVFSVQFVYDPSRRGSYATAVVTLAHASVAVYIVSNEFTQEYKYDLKQGPSHAFLAQTCVDYLFYFAAHTVTLSTIFANYPLTAYATQYWNYHLLRGDSQPTLQLLQSGSRQYLDLYSLFFTRLTPERDVNPLTLCSQLGYTEGVRFILGKGADLKEVGCQALQKASKKGHIDIVCLLLENGINVNTDGCPALHEAFRADHIDILRLLLQNGAKANADGLTLQQASKKGRADLALQEASWGGHTDIVRLLLDNGAKVNADGCRALQDAAQRGCTDIVRLLLENGANYANGCQALQKASEAGHTGIAGHCRKLPGEAVQPWCAFSSENGADANTDGGYALVTACVQGHMNIIHLLLQNGADANGCQALQKASKAGNAGIVRLLLETALMSMQIGMHWRVASGEGNIDIVRLLLESGADPDTNGGRALQEASGRGHAEVVRLLLENGANVNTDGAIALQEASWGGHTEIVHLLLEKEVTQTSVRLLLANGANINADRCDPLREASRRGYTGIVDLLLENGACVSADALHEASSAGHTGIVHLLLQKCAVNTQDCQALRDACVAGYTDIVRLLLENGAHLSAEKCRAVHETYKRYLALGIYSGKVRAMKKRHTKIMRLLVEEGAFKPRGQIEITSLFT